MTKILNSIDVLRIKDVTRQICFNCEFCTSIFQSQIELKAHILDHFLRKFCSECNIGLLKVCDDWYEVHTANNCASNADVRNIKLDPDEGSEAIEIKEETTSLKEEEVDMLSAIIENDDLSNGEPIVDFQSLKLEPIISEIQSRNDEIVVPDATIEHPESNIDKQKDTACHICHKVMSSMYRLRYHINAVHHTGKTYNCQRCKRLYISQLRLKKHSLVCGGKRKDKNQDDSKRKRRKYYPVHEHRPKSNFICDICNKVLSSYYSTREHMASTHFNEVEAFPCGQCNETFSSRYWLSKHLAHHKNPSETTVQQPDAEEQIYNRPHIHRPKTNFVCDICQKIMQNYHTTKRHMTTHIPKQFKCGKCDLICMTKSILQSHRRKHREKKPRSICSFCGKSFLERSKMLAHEQNHMGIKTSCNICNKSFWNKHYLKLHVAHVHNKEKRFKCDIDNCKWAFSTTQILKRHKARKHGIVKNRNPCPICSKEFPESRYHLNKHLKAHEKNTAKEYIKPST